MRNFHAERILSQLETSPGISFVTNFHAERILSLHVTSSRILLEEHLFREDPLATLLSLAVDLVGPRVDKL